MIKIFICLLLMTVFSLASDARDIQREPALSKAFPPPPPGHLFSSYEPLQLKLSAPLTTLFKYKSDGIIQAKKKSVEGKISYLGADQRQVEIPVKIHLKGFTSLHQCRFPKLELKFKAEHTAKTAFAGIKTVDLNTHCSEANDESVNAWFRSSHYNHREALAYRMMDILAMPSLRARPALLTYQDLHPASTVTIQPSYLYQAFLLEDMADFRRRLNLKDIKGFHDPFKQITIIEEPEKAGQFQFKSVKESKQVDPEDVARIALFQFLVGNNDWFVRLSPEHLRSPGDQNNLWNTKLVETADKRWVFVAQDFSLSALQNAGGLAPLNQQIFSVVDRPAQEKIKAQILAKKREIELALETLKADPQFENLKKYLKSAFEQIEKL